MISPKHFAHRIPKVPPIHRTQWPRTWSRLYSSEAEKEPSWFRTMREEMLHRELRPLHDRTGIPHERKLEHTLSTFVPKEWLGDASQGRELPIGRHLIYFNPSLPPDQLLPDGTDAMHSPGGPFVRRMWAGGELKVNVDRYFDLERGWTAGNGYSCVERIRDVQLRGHDDAAKIFVSIERRFTRDDVLSRSDGALAGRWEKSAVAGDHTGGSEDLGNALLVEERKLVFLKERSAAEIESFRAGQTVPIKYLKCPDTPEFSHSLTPTPSLLFRYSALTWNAHAIHLDTEYARNVEGHRGLLVHGPLSLTLVLMLVTNHLKSLAGLPQTIQSIEYRNLTPLYCNESMRLCGRERAGSKTEDGGVYDVWIEGPTGGMAFKGMVRTSRKPTRTFVRQGDTKLGTKARIP